ncbi:MmcQ/YjbR family DNA-binding protein [Epilithonimonas sp.]|uniref:MmcQ/YjbR family DNA-binding protein n=1 Tax=Epilithonimonas sp. TaxID=2894511 RepID=UPI0028A0599B|nr:MmcQ/YjbR family DNA-binding protein [Epilithonimonas sp.]
MEIEEIRDYCLHKKGITESFPFDNETLVFKVGGKMFLLISLEKHPETFAAKADPEWSEELRENHPQISGAYHMNKTHWNSVTCEGLKKELILKLIDHSYNLVFDSLTKKSREEISNS